MRAIDGDDHFARSNDKDDEDDDANIGDYHDDNDDDDDDDDDNDDADHKDDDADDVREEEDDAYLGQPSWQSRGGGCGVQRILHISHHYGTCHLNVAKQDVQHTQFYTGAPVTST
eukprot:12408671-Karenia_brevis.AAC.1